MTRVILLILALVIFVSLTMSFSDADFTVQKEIAQNSFRAIVLDFSSSSSATEEKISGLFNLERFVPGGVETKMVRLLADKNNQEIPMNIKFVQKNDLNSLCPAINLLLLRRWQKVYEGGLTDFLIKLENFGDKEDLAFVLNRNTQKELNGQCVFDFVFEQGKEGKGFFARRTLSNQIY